MIRFPPICSRHVIFFGRNGHRPDKSHFLRPPKVFLEGGGTQKYVPPPPPIIARYVSPPLYDFPSLVSELLFQGFLGFGTDKTSLFWGLFFLAFSQTEQAKEGHESDQKVAKMKKSTPMCLPLPQGFWLRGTNSDHGPNKTQTKTQTTPDSAFTIERRNSDHGLSFWQGKTQAMVWISVSQKFG